VANYYRATDRTPDHDPAAVAFFLANAGCDRESAEVLADAERWLDENDGSVEWRIDDEYDPADYSDTPADEPQLGWGCVVTVRGVVASLWAVTFDGDGYPGGNRYARVVAAELASELMNAGA
jgi:hypothetical protein